jgi:hypothetical protein
MRPSDLPRLREAARILEKLTAALHVVSEGDHLVDLALTVPVATFDRLCLWGAASEDLEDDELGDEDPMVA